MVSQKTLCMICEKRETRSYPFIDARRVLEEVFLLVRAADGPAVVADQLLDGIHAPAAPGDKERQANTDGRPTPRRRRARVFMGGTRSRRILIYSGSRENIVCFSSETQAAMKQGKKDGSGTPVGTCGLNGGLESLNYYTPFTYSFL